MEAYPLISAKGSILDPSLAPVVGREFPSEVARTLCSIPSAEVCVEGQGEIQIAAAEEESSPAELARVVM
ncbi:hypothetical protein SRHO_G00079450 [Serrasalmus rhombeus]